MGNITTESNQMRKSHRVDLPLTVQIDGVSYKTKDWSMNSIGILDLEEDLEAGQVIESQCMFPMIDSMIVLNIKLEFKRRFKNCSGFEFIGLSPQVHRVLRQYIELAMEGKLNGLEDVVSVLTMPMLETPLEDALTLSDEEEGVMAKHFKSGSTVAIVAGVFFLFILLATLFYNTSYRVDGIGVAGETLQRERAPAAGIISNLSGIEGTFVRKGELLFSVIGSTDADKVRQIQFKIAQLSLQKKGIKKGARSSVRLSAELEARVRAQQEAYNKANALYAQHIISSKDINRIAEQLQNARIAYARNEQARHLRLDDPDGKQLSLQLQAYKKELDQFVDNRASIKAPVDGRIFHIDVQEGSYVNAGDIVMVMEADVTPDIVLKLQNFDAIKVHVGMPATIELPFNGKKLQAVVYAIGYNAVYGTSSPTQEVSLNETLIKLQLSDFSIRIPANTRVKVWIKTFEWAKHLPWKD